MKHKYIIPGMLLLSVPDEDVISTSGGSNNALGPKGDNCVDNIFKPSDIS